MAITAAMPMLVVVPVDGAKIRELREQAGVSMAEAARRAGMKHRQQWYQVETGRIPDPTVSTLQRIAHVLGVEPADLLTPLDGEEWKQA